MKPKIFELKTKKILLAESDPALIPATNFGNSVNLERSASLEDSGTLHFLEGISAGF